jgi:hypothetical protein
VPVTCCFAQRNLVYATESLGNKSCHVYNTILHLQKTTVEITLKLVFVLHFANMKPHFNAVSHSVNLPLFSLLSLYISLVHRLTNLFIIILYLEYQENISLSVQIENFQP